MTPARRLKKDLERGLGPVYTEPWRMGALVHLAEAAKAFHTEGTVGAKAQNTKIHEPCLGRRLLT